MDRSDIVHSTHRYKHILPSKYSTVVSFVFLLLYIYFFNWSPFCNHLNVHYKHVCTNYHTYIYIICKANTIMQKIIIIINWKQTYLYGKIPFQLSRHQYNPNLDTSPADETAVVWLIVFSPSARNSYLKLITTITGPVNPSRALPAKRMLCWVSD